MDSGSTDDGQHLITVDYGDDTERKRAEYLLDNWEDGAVEKVRGLTRKTSGVDPDELYEQLAAKVPQEKISVYELDRVDTEATEERATLRESFDDVDSERLGWAMESLMNKRKGALVDSRDDGKKYSVYTKKGRAKIRYEIRPNDDGSVALDVTIEGYGEAPEFLKEYIADELQYMIN